MGNMGRAIPQTGIIAKHNPVYCLTLTPNPHPHPMGQPVGFNSRHYKPYWPYIMLTLKIGYTDGDRNFTRFNGSPQDAIAYFWDKEFCTEFNGIESTRVCNHLEIIISESDLESIPSGFHAYGDSAIYSPDNGIIPIGLGRCYLSDSLKAKLFG